MKQRLDPGDRRPFQLTPMWALSAIVIITLIAALLYAYREVHAAAPDVWTIRIISVDREKGEATLRLIDLEELVSSHNRQVEQIDALRRATGCI